MIQLLKSFIVAFEDLKLYKQFFLFLKDMNDMFYIFFGIHNFIN